jgi:hypothetical protein
MIAEARPAQSSNLVSWLVGDAVGFGVRAGCGKNAERAERETGEGAGHELHASSIRHPCKTTRRCS